MLASDGDGFWRLEIEFGNLSIVLQYTIIQQVHIRIRIDFKSVQSRPATRISDQVQALGSS